MSKHTPGPWFAIQNTAGAWDVNVEDSPYGQTVSSCGLDNRYIEGDAEANACLIAAAPFLLAALEELVDIVEDMLAGNTDVDSFTTQPAKKACSEARGEL